MSHLSLTFSYCVLPATLGHRLSGQSRVALTWAFVAHSSAKALQHPPHSAPPTTGPCLDLLSVHLSDSLASKLPATSGDQTSNLCLLRSRSPCFVDPSSRPQLEGGLLAENQGCGGSHAVRVPSLRGQSCTACYLRPKSTILSNDIIAYNRGGGGGWPRQFLSR